MLAHMIHAIITLCSFARLNKLRKDFPEISLRKLMKQSRFVWSNTAAPALWCAAFLHSLECCIVQTNPYAATYFKIEQWITFNELHVCFSRG